MFLGQAVAKRQIAAGRGGKQIHLLSVRAQLGIARPRLLRLLRAPRAGW